MKKLFGFTPIIAEKDDLSDSSEPRTQLQNAQRDALHITPDATPTPTPTPLPVHPAPRPQVAGPPEGRGAAPVAAPGVPQSSLVQHMLTKTTRLSREPNERVKQQKQTKKQRYR